MLQLLAHLCGDYILQSDWMAQNKTKRSWPAFVHALLYSLCFLPLCWVAARHIPERHVDVQPTRVIIHTQAAVTAAINIDGSYKIPAEHTPGRFRWAAWLVIFSTHFLIDRFRLARYVVWVKNWMGPKKLWYRIPYGGGIRWTDDAAEASQHAYKKIDDYYIFHGATPPLWACPTGYSPLTPIWLATWLLIIADNTCHIFLNYLALRYL